jgi:hypothetical protein
MMRRLVVGDLVSRDGTDVHRVLYVNEPGDMIEVECIEPPASGWCKVGEHEYNVPWRYCLVAGLTQDGLMNGEALLGDGA